MQKLSDRWNTAATWYIGIETYNRPWGISAASKKKVGAYPFVASLQKKRERVWKNDLNISWRRCSSNFWLPVCNGSSRYLISSSPPCLLLDVVVLIHLCFIFNTAIIIPFIFHVSIWSSDFLQFLIHCGKIWWGIPIRIKKASHQPKEMPVEYIFSSVNPSQWNQFQKWFTWKLNIVGGGGFAGAS